MGHHLFRELAIGQEFDFVGPDRTMNSFFLRCTKTGERTYRDEHGVDHRVGSIRCVVYNVGQKTSQEK